MASAKSAPAASARNAPKGAAEPVEALFGGRAIVVRGAREHNLKNVDLTIPRDKLVVFTGLSGSGKSSLAFDTIYAEGQRRYVESLSAYARQFLEMMQKPDVDQIDGLSPAIAIEQKTTSKNPRSTVGTVTEIHDYMRLLWARVGVPYSPATGLPIESQTVSQMVDRVLGSARAHPPLPHRAGRARPQGRIPQGDRRLHEARLPAAEDRRRIQRDRRRAGARQEAQARHRSRGRPDRRAPRHGQPARRELRDRARACRRPGGGRIRRPAGGRRRTARILFSSKFACPVSGFTIAEIEPRLFSFNNPFGACPVCGGLGSQLTVDPSLVVPDPRLTLRRGAIAPWAKSSSPYYLQTLEALGRHYQVPPRQRRGASCRTRARDGDPPRLGRRGDPHGL